MPQTANNAHSGPAFFAMHKIFWSLAVWLIVSFHCEACLADALPRSVLILNDSGGPTIQGYLDITLAERSTLNAQSPSPFALYVENLDLNQFQGPEYDKT